MKLYLSPGACSMSCHIAFEEAGIKFEPILTSDEIKKLNPMHAVPVLQFEANDPFPGQVLTQNIAILSYAASTPGGAKLLAKPGTLEHARTYQWLSFVAADLHPSFSPLWREGLPEADRKNQVQIIGELLEIVEKQLGESKFIAGNDFSIADAYLFTVYGWCPYVKIDTSAYKNLNAYSARVFERPAVQAVMKREELI